MKFHEIVSPSRKDLFVRQIETMILQGALQAGEKLPNERELAKQMKVSRSIINNGMQELADKAFVRIVPRQGAYVEDYIRNGNINTLVALVKNKGINFDPRLLHSFIEFRRDLETTCAKAAADRRTAQQLKELKEKLQHMVQAVDTEAFLEESIELHKLIFLASDNVVYPLIYNAFYEPLYVVTDQLLTCLSHHVIVDNLQHVIDAIERQDGADAHAQMQHHVDVCAGVLTDYYQSVGVNSGY